MSDRKALEEAAAADPQDGTRLLVLADCVQEAGDDEYADLLRSQDAVPGAGVWSRCRRISPGLDLRTAILLSRAFRVMGEDMRGKSLPLVTQATLPRTILVDTTS